MFSRFFSLHFQVRFYLNCVDFSSTQGRAGLVVLLAGPLPAALSHPVLERLLRETDPVKGQIVRSAQQQRKKISPRENQNRSHVHPKQQHACGAVSADFRPGTCCSHHKEKMTA